MYGKGKKSIRRCLTDAGKPSGVPYLMPTSFCTVREPGETPASTRTTTSSFSWISRAYERLSLIVTTNLPFESWTEVFGSERLTGALLDRLTHRVHILEANGPSYRLRESQHRLHPGGSQPDQRAPTDPEEPGPEDGSKK